MERSTGEQQDIEVAAKQGDAGFDLFEMLEARYGTDADPTAFRPIKKPVTIRLDEDVLDWIKGYGPGYQTRLNLLLRHTMMTDTRHLRRD